MKICVVLLMVFMLQVSANVYSQNIMISLDFKEAAIEEVLTKIESETKFIFFYRHGIIDNLQKINIHAENRNIHEVLDQIFLGTDIDYSVKDRLIILGKKGVDNVSVFQGINITGTITDQIGDPMPGVNVVIKGTSTGVVTGVDGTYSISVPDRNAVLIFSFMGYTTQEFVVGERTGIDVILNEDVREIEEIVVVGYGVQKKINLTGSVSSISSDKLINRPTPNFATALAGLAPGVRITQSSGNPGSEDVSIQIRGLGSINGGSPMILIDGVSSELSVINPDDVESISILKDAASAAIYGSRAANGVILVTTKKGKKEKPQVTASAMFAVEKPITSLRFESNTATHMRLHNTAQRNTTPNSTSFPFDEQTILEWEEANKNPNGTYTHPVTGNTIPNWLAYPNTDWATVLFKPTLYQRYNIAISGGSDHTTYMLSGSFQNNPGTLENTSQKRFNIRANVESRIANFLTIGTQTYAIKQFKDPGSASFTYLNEVYPGTNAKYKGLYGASENPLMSNVHNPLQEVAVNGGKNENTRINTLWYANADIWNGISAEAKFNYNEYQEHNERYSQNLPTYRFREGTENPIERITTLENATSYRSTSNTASYQVNLFLRYTGSFGNHDINAFAAYEQIYWKSSGFNATKKGLLDWNVIDITSATTMESIGGTAKQELAMLSYFGRLNYAYKNRYLFEANIRADGSSRFAPGHRWGTFSAFSAGWRISEESFFEPLRSYIDNLKLKASYGELGNQVSGYYDWQSTYAKASAVLGQSVQNAVKPDQMPNFLMSWEKTSTTNIGFESNFLKQRLSLEVEYFTRKTTDMLVQPSVYLTMGNIGVPQTNSASLMNRGIDINVGWNDRVGDLRYFVNANLGYSANKITKYQGKLKYEEDPNILDIWGNPTLRYTNLADASTGGDNRIVEGHPHNEFFLRRPYQGTETYTNTDSSVDPRGGPKDGMIRTKADIDWVREMIAAGHSFNNYSVDPNGSASLWYGEMLYEDANGDGKYGNEDDRDFTGKMTIPKWTFGLNLSVEWKGIDMSMSWSGRLGSYHYISQRSVTGSYYGSGYFVMPANAQTMFYSYDAVAASANGGVNDYDPAGDPDANYMGKYPRLVYSNSTMVANTFYLYNTSYLKLKSLQVGYTLPRKWLEQINISNLRVFVTGENLLSIQDKNFPSVDPELGNAFQVYPIAKIFSGGITVTF